MREVESCYEGKTKTAMTQSYHQVIGNFSRSREETNIYFRIRYGLVITVNTNLRLKSRVE